MTSRNLNNIWILLGASLSLTACSGADGERGANGSAGTTSIVTTTDEPAGANCAAGGVRITSGLDADGDGTLSAEEGTTTRYVCDGEQGEDGETGDKGDQGDKGDKGDQGPPGADGGAGNCAGATPIEITGVTGVESTPYFRGFASAPITVTTNAQDPQIAFVTTGVTFESTGTAGEYTFTPSIVGDGIGVAVIATDGCTTATSSFVIPTVELAETTVRIVHLFPGAGEVDIRVAGSSDTLRSVNFGASTQPLVVESGDYTFDVVLAADDSIAITSPQLMLAPGTDVTIVAHADAANMPALLVLTDDVSAPAAGNARIRAIHAASGVGDVDILNLSADPVAALFSDVAFGTATAAIEVPAAQYEVGIDADDDGTADFEYSLPELPEGVSANAFAFINADDEPALFVQALIEDNSFDRIVNPALQAQALPAVGMPLTINGVLEAGDETWVRPGAGCLSGFTTMYYDIYPFKNTTANTLLVNAAATFGAMPSVTGYMFSYSNEPVSSPGSAAIAGCNETAVMVAASRQSVLTRAVAPGQTTYLIVSVNSGTTSTTGIGTYDLTVTTSSEPAFEGPFTNNTPLSIPDNTTASFVSNTVTVAAASPTCTVSTVRVTVDLTHTWRADVLMKLTSPDGTEVNLHNRTGSSADNIIGIYPNTLTPAQSLANFAGKAANGVWTMSLNDGGSGDTGTLNSWSLEVACQ